MYFENFPITYYSLHDLSNVKVVTNITRRVQISDEVKNTLGVYDEYDVQDGETPELVAEKFYNNPELHWLILLYNDIIDPRFDWVLPYNSFIRVIEGKYNNINAIHHFEDNDEAYTNGNVYIQSNAAFGSFVTGDVISNNTNIGTAVITSKISSSNVVITVSTGGFITGDQIKLSSNASVTANITSTTIISGTPITNYTYEDSVNESKRRIRILKNAFTDLVVKDFKQKLEF
jgi:hypothetical protein